MKQGEALHTSSKSGGKIANYPLIDQSTAPGGQQDSVVSRLNGSYVAADEHVSNSQYLSLYNS